MKVANEVLAAIMSRRSVRAYLPAPVPEDVLSAILEAGQAAAYVAPDSRHFAVIRDRAIAARLNADAKEAVKDSGNATLKRMCENPTFDGTYGAPVVVVLSGNERTIQYEAVCSASAQNMLIAAQSLGIASCWAYFPVFAFHGEKAGEWRERFCIQAGYKPYASVLLGYGHTQPGTGADTRYKNLITYVPEGI